MVGTTITTFHGKEKEIPIDSIVVMGLNGMSCFLVSGRADRGGKIISLVGLVIYNVDLPDELKIFVFFSNFLG